MTTKVGLHICGRVYSSLRGIPQANEEVWEAAPGLGGVSYPFWGWFPIGYVSRCILMYPACILHVF